jgi:Co/Zn/Cd efflux system component
MGQPHSHDTGGGGHRRGHDEFSHHGHGDHGHEGHGHGSHGHGETAGHGRAGVTGMVSRVVHGLRPHSHEPGDQVDAALEASAEGMRVLWVSLGILAGTAAVQAVVAALSGSVALLGDTRRTR